MKFYFHLRLEMWARCTRIKNQIPVLILLTNTCCTPDWTFAIQCITSTFLLHFFYSFTFSFNICSHNTLFKMQKLFRNFIYPQLFFLSQTEVVGLLWDWNFILTLSFFNSLHMTESRISPEK